MTAEDVTKALDLGQTILDTFYWLIAFQVVNMCLLLISLFFIALKAGKG